MTIRRGRSIGLACSAVVAIAVGLLLFETGAVEEIELDTVDQRFELRGAQPITDRVAIVAVDEASLEDLGSWPFTGAVHASLVDRLAASGAETIAYDLPLSGMTRPRDDKALGRAISRSTRDGTPVVLGSTQVSVDGSTGLLNGDRRLNRSGARAANSSFLLGPDWVVRRFFASEQGLPGLAVAAVEEATGLRADPDAFGEEGAWIDYRGDMGTMPSYSFSDVVGGRVGESDLAGRIVVVGGTAPNLTSKQGTVFGGLMPAPEVQANAISTALRGTPLKSAPAPLDLGLIIVLGMFAPVLGARIRPPIPFLSSVLLVVVVPLAAMLAFSAGLIVAIVAPLIALGIGAVGTLVTNLISTVLERTRTRETFTRFVPEDVVDSVLERAGEDLRLGGIRCDSTVLFCDLRGFTSFSETLAPDEVVSLLNVYFSEMTDAIMGHGGTLLCYMGDGIMAVFGAPLPQEDHADRALAAAREMLDLKLPVFNHWMRKHGYDQSFEMGIGVNSGEVFSGQVGSPQRLDYTTIGDTTNTASRLEGMTKESPHSLFFSEATRGRLSSDPSGLIEVGDFPVRGRRQPITIWTVAGDRSAGGWSDAGTDLTAGEGDRSEYAANEMALG